MLDLVRTHAAAIPPTDAGPLTRPLVLKFGGSSVATPARIRQIARIVIDSAAASDTVVVVSAFKGVTDQLLECARRAADADPEADALFDVIAARHYTAASALLGGDGREAHDHVDHDLRELRQTLDGVRLLGSCPPATLDVVASFGERLSAAIVAGHLNLFRPARFADARDFVTTDDQFTKANVVFAKTNLATRDYFADLWREAPGALVVVTGFIARSEDGRTTTIGRNGSDYTAAIVGAALGASAIEIWTDVDGVLSADPKAVPSTFVLPQISYDDALELSHAGAQVLHPGTIGPAIAKSIPILVKNSFRPAAAGTRIADAQPDRETPAGGVTCIDGLTLLTLRSNGRTAGRSTAERLLHGLSARDIHVALATQAASGQTISFAVRDPDAVRAVDAVQEEFCFELERGFASLTERAGQAMITTVTTATAERPALVGRVFDALGSHDIAVNAFSQGATVRSVACVVDACAQARALRAIHHELFERGRTLPVALVGVGNVGAAVLAEIARRRDGCRARGVELRLIALADSKRCLVEPDGIDPVDWKNVFLGGGRPMSTAALAGAIAELGFSDGAFVDCTASADLVDVYPRFIDAHFHVVTPNKHAGVLPWTRYAALRDAFATRRRRFLDATTVGAGVPVLATLRDLHAGGDRVRKIEGVLSGTLSHLFSSFDGRVPFSALVRDALAAGMTEPDPREDLSGHDVARKLLILAREIGLRMERADIDTEGLLPAALHEGPFSADFFTALAAHDNEFQRRLEAAGRRNAVLRYIATLDDGRAQAALREVPRDHPLADARGTENIVAITSDRYPRDPLVIRGPGAGAAVTARAIVADLCRLVQPAYS